MSSKTSDLKRIIIIPRNGYLNRLQAIASAAIIAENLDIELKIYWETELNWATNYRTLFDVEYFRDKFVNKAYLDTLTVLKKY